MSEPRRPSHGQNHMLAIRKRLSAMTMISAADDMDAKAMLRCQQGDLSALDDLVLRYQLQVVRVAYLLVHDYSSAEDIAQESFLQVYRNCHLFKYGQPFAPWLYRIVLNTARQLLRTRKRHPALSLEHHLEMNHQLSLEEFPAFSTQTDSRAVEADPSQRLEQAEMRAAVLAILRTLTSKQREALVLRYYCGYTDKEVTQILGIPGGTVRWRLHSALKAFELSMRRLHPWLAGDAFTAVIPQALSEVKKYES
jgi:RNA polymerase sigma-70 factor, ECF subfamily